VNNRTPGTWECEPDLRHDHPDDPEWFIVHPGTACDISAVGLVRREADARSIVRAVNAHDGLVHALALLLGEADAARTSDYPLARETPGEAAARAALKKAREK
jgi:hypothetical protein